MTTLGSFIPVSLAMARSVLSDIGLRDLFRELSVFSSRKVS